MSNPEIQMPAPAARKSWIWRELGHGRPVVMTFAVLIVLLGLTSAISPYPLSYFDISFMASGGATTSLAAMGQTLVILSGGFDLSAGAVVSLVNAVLASQMDSTDFDASVPLWTAIGVAVGMSVGAFNGFFIGFLRLQPIVVTLATMFIVQGLTLLVLDKPGGFISPSIGAVYMGDAIPNVLPTSIVLIGAVILLWLWLKRTPFGLALYAVGSDPEAATATGLRTNWIIFFTYVLAGGLYGLAGVFVSAQTGSGDPLIGNSLLLPTFAAVVIGGTRLGGGKGGLVGTVFGAYILMVVVNILLSLNVSAYYSTIAESAVLILAVLAGSMSKDSPLAHKLRGAREYLAARRKGTLVSQRATADNRLRFAAHSKASEHPAPGFWIRNGVMLRYTLPAFACLLIVLVVTQMVLGNVFTSFRYWDALLVLSSFLAILALGQGAVILTGGLDLSVPWMIGLSGILVAGIVHGSNGALIFAIPVVLIVSVAIGTLNGLGVVALGLSPIVVTLAMNGLLQGAALIYSNGTPDGFAAPALRWMMTGEIAGITPIIPALAVFVIGAVLLLGRTAFGRRLYAIGNSEIAARLSGVNTGKTLIGVYIMSAVCAALVGILLTGFSGQASLGMGDDYLLPSIAVVVVGGALITGGRGHYIGMFGGALLLTAMQTLLAGTTLPFAFRSVFFGLVILAAVIALREKRTT
ncbi:ABC transporter permease [Pelagibius sp. Alg239-R121]|uniref:ABC transporter permease n=1 Tax=Pelagibius sp. Alg239-R121 TaxID=2993448 RepID=UPI002AC34CF1|nr:ABC transporter permease [Pelagibius sp. Alg239-R121]